VRLVSMKYSLVVLISLCCGSSFAQTAVLFLGNSYTAYNNLPQLTADLAASAGFQMTVGSNTPGGFSFNGHSANATSQQLIGQGTWDYVVLQEQSQIPSFPISQVESDCFPFAELLNDQILDANPCAETVFYMTWGRENGDSQNCANWPPVCTYEGMDDLLYERYMQMADDNEALVSPVGRVWRFLRENFPQIQLYSGDGSHPSAAGSYAAACTMFSVIFEADPELISDDFALAAADAATIRSAVHQVVYDNPDQWFIGTYDLTASFIYEEGENNSVTFISTSLNADGASFFWDAGFTTAESATAEILFPGPGNYDVTLTVTTPCEVVSTSQTVVVGSNGLDVLREEPFRLNPNPSRGWFVLQPIKSFSGDEGIVTDVMGREVLRFEINDRPVRTDQLPGGVYFVRVSNWSTRLIVE
jgi:hypothetical protein